MNNRKIRTRDCSYWSLSDANINSINSYFGNYDIGPPLQRPRIQSVEGTFSGTNSRCVGTNPSDFYAAERLLGFPKFESQRGMISNKDMFETRFGVNLEKQNYTLESLVNFDIDAHRHAQGNPPNCTVECEFPNNLNSILNFDNEKGASNATGTGVQNKPRIRWSQDLHEKFVESVELLGGAEKATPKGILSLMKAENLTICHVKSHLQKYRTAKFMPQSSKGKFERQTSSTEAEQLNPQTGIQISEALKMQLEVQRSLHEQLEVQRKLQIRIEEQGRKLQKMFEEQMKANGNSENVFSDENSEEMNNETPSKIS